MKQESLNVFCCCKKSVLILAMICGRVIEFLKVSTFKVFKKELQTFLSWLLEFPFTSGSLSVTG